MGDKWWQAIPPNLWVLLFGLLLLLATWRYLRKGQWCEAIPRFVLAVLMIVLAVETQGVGYLP